MLYNIMCSLLSFFGCFGNCYSQQARKCGKDADAGNLLTVVVSLCQNILVRLETTQHHADKTVRGLHGNHYPEGRHKKKDCYMCAAVLGSRKKGTSQKVLVHASGLTIHRPLSNYCALKHMDQIYM